MYLGEHKATMPPVIRGHNLLWFWLQRLFGAALQLYLSLLIAENIMALYTDSIFWTDILEHQASFLSSQYKSKWSKISLGSGPHQYGPVCIQGLSPPLIPHSCIPFTTVWRSPVPLPESRTLLKAVTSGTVTKVNGIGFVLSWSCLLYSTKTESKESQNKYPDRYHDFRESQLSLTCQRLMLDDLLLITLLQTVAR